MSDKCQCPKHIRHIYTSNKENVLASYLLSETMMGQLNVCQSWLRRGDFSGPFGWCVWIFFSSFAGVQSPLFAEPLAAIIAFKTSKDKGWHNIWLECDSLLVIQAFKMRLWFPSLSVGGGSIVSLFVIT